MNSFSLNAMRLPFPTDWTEIFGQAAPLILEIGFGDGRFLEGLARAFPDHHLIGIERAHAPMSWTEQRIMRHKFEHVRLIYGEAYMSLRCLFAPESLNTIHINFSDPWFKRRHHDRRLIDQEFLQTLVSRLEPDGLLYIATDILEYAEQINTALQATSGISNAHPTDWINHRDLLDIVTRYEGKAQRIGRTCYYFKYYRDTTPVTHPDPIQLDEETMPNAVINLALNPTEIAENFQPFVRQQDERTVSFKAAFLHSERPTLIIETIIEEPLFSQHIMLSVNQREAGAYIVKLGKVGFPRATPGTHDAVYHLTHWLTSLHPEAKIIHLKTQIPNP